MPYEPRQRFALALGGVITELNGAHHHELGGWGLNEHTSPWCKNTLAQFYGVDGPEAFQRTVRWLWSEGHRAEALAMLAELGDPREDSDRQAVLRSYGGELQGRGLLAWDLGRLVCVVGWGTWAEYVSEDDAWRLLLGAAQYARQHYSSWQEFGRHYEIGRLWWANGQAHAATEAALRKLTSDPNSPWMTLPWDLPLTAEPGGKRHLLKKVVCGGCGAPKALPPKTAYVYCDHCGELCDYDFRVACSRPSALPGPAYEALRAQIAGGLDAAKKKGDRKAYHEQQKRLYEAYVVEVPMACPPRVGDERYRARYVDYFASTATDNDFDPTYRGHAEQVAAATRALQWEPGDPRKPKIRPATFWKMFEAVIAQTDRAFVLSHERGTMEKHPDGANEPLLRKITWSMFTQGWIPFLPQADADALIARTDLGGDYVDVVAPTVLPKHCGGCGGGLEVVEGATRVVCEACGKRVEVGSDEIPCAGCGGAISLPESADRTGCPYCGAQITRVKW